MFRTPVKRSRGKRSLPVVLMGGLAVLGVAPAAARPQVLSIVADDLGWKDVGFNGCTAIRRPHFEWLAVEGPGCRVFMCG